MELWIRSQNKERLSSVKTLFIEDINVDNKLFVITDGYVYYGEYESEERALEILDEIQEIMTNLADSDLKIIQYEMPKD